MKRILILTLIILIGLAGCKAQPTQNTTPSPVDVTPLPPTATLVPMALTVNGQGIPVAEYEAGLKRLQDAQQSIGQVGTEQEQKERVNTNYIDELLLAQAAAQNGHVVDDTELQSRIDQLATEIGGMDILTTWLDKNGYTLDTFRESLRRAILVTFQRDEIINAVPTTAEQVHARQILVQDEDNANYEYAQLKTGSDFKTRAHAYDPVLDGDLGWFPQWGLTQQNVADAAFALQPDHYSEVIKSEIGYHIVYVIARETDHPLSVDARRMLQEKALQDWLAAARTTSTIEILVK